MRLAQLLVLVAAATLVLPGLAIASHGAWGGYGGRLEPNTKWDTRAFMPQGPTQLKADRVYFNGLLVKMDTLALSRYETNLDGSITGPGGYVFAAVLGFWRDCNRDGYIGAHNVPATQGNFAVYHRDLSLTPVDENVCPLGSAYNPRHSQTGAPNAFVNEFRWIGPGARCDAHEPGCPGNTGAFGTPVCVQALAFCTKIRQGTTNPPSDVSDAGARVWADWRAPGERHLYSTGLYGAIVVDGKPPGTYYDSDGTLQWTDDALGQGMASALGDAWDAKPNVGACDADEEFLEGPENGLPTGTCGAWPLYQLKRAFHDGDVRPGGDGAPQPFVHVFDTGTDANDDGNPCNDAQNVDVEQTETHVNVDTVSGTPNGNVLVRGSIEGQLRNTAGGADVVVSGDDRSSCAGTVTGEALQFESPASAPEYTHRAPTDAFVFVPDNRSRLLDDFGFEHAPLDGAGALTGVGSIGIPGWGVADAASANVPSQAAAGWYGTTGWTARPPRHGWGALDSIHATFYADVTNEALTGASTPASVALPGGVQDRHVYGSDFCTTFTTGPANVNPANDWDCSVTSWLDWRVAQGAPTRVVIGNRYDLRDVDCYDNTLSESLTGDLQAGIAPSCSATHGP